MQGLPPSLLSLICPLFQFFVQKDNQRFSFESRLTVSCRREMRMFKVSVHIIEPGFHKTNITSVDALRGSLETVWEKLPQHYKEEYGREYVDKCKYIVIDLFVDSGI